MEYDWRTLRFYLFQALDCLRVCEIYKLDRENNVITLCIILETGDTLREMRELTKLHIIDKLIEKNAPDIYRAYLFCYEVWDKQTWCKQRVKDVIDRRRGRPL